MPAEDEPSLARWGPAIGKEIAALADGGVVIGHSIGGTILISALGQQPPQRRLAAILLVSALFVGEGGWPGDEFALPGDLGARLPPGAAVHLFQGLNDETTPAAHAGLYARAIPQADVHRLAGRDHQLNDDLSEVAEVVRAIQVGRRREGAGNSANSPNVRTGPGGGRRRSPGPAQELRKWRRAPFETRAKVTTLHMPSMQAGPRTAPGPCARPDRGERRDRHEIARL